MNLEMAIRDWQQRLDKQAAEIERLRELLRGLDDGGHWYSQQTMDAVRREKDELRAERDAWRKLVLEHNAIVKDLNRRIKREDELRWPHEYRIAIPPELSADSFESDLRALARTAGGEAPSFAEKLLAARIAPEMEPKP